MLKFMKPLFAAALLLSTIPMAACHTMAGAGQDIEHTGQEITETSNEVYREM
tara:strand:+ start:1801 stop:1956 length:156 start_codon:yes stop_codon:yes gene_type:complete